MLFLILFLFNFNLCKSENEVREMRQKNILIPISPEDKTLDKFIYFFFDLTFAVWLTFSLNSFILTI